MAKRACHRVASGVCVAAVLSTAGGVCVAQQPESEKRGSLELEEVIVTATKRSENLQDVPISISAITGDQIAARGLNNFNELGASIAGLNFIGQTSILAKIRGVGTNDGTAGNESSVAVYVDGVYLATLFGFLRKMHDIAQVEVAKGPQGTLFGRNAVGGVINITTKEPTQDYNGTINVGYGNYETVSADAYFSGGLTENLAANLSLYYSDQREGYGTNIFTGSEVNETKDVAARSKWVYSPNDRNKLTLGMDYARVETSGGNLPHALEGTYHPNLLGGPPIPAPDIEAWSIDSFWDPYSELEQYGASLRYEHSFDFANFLSISAYRRYNTLTIIPSVIPFPTQLSHWEQEDDSWTQELQLSSNSEGKFEWTTGVFFLDGEQGYPELSFIGALIAPLQKFDIGPTWETARSWAGFAQGTIDLSASGKTRLTLGGRYTRDERALTGMNVLTRADGTKVEINHTDVERTWSKATYRVVLDHRFNDGVLGYLSYNQGFKSGLFSTTSLRPNNAVPFVNPEVLDAYEIGLKNELFNGRMRLNVAAYYYDFTDLQVQIRGTTATTITNGAKAEIYGLDVDFEARVTDRLTLTAAVSKSNNEYKSFPNAPFVLVEPDTVGGNRGVPGDGAGKQLNYAPELTGSASATYTVPASFGQLSFNGNYAYSDGWFNTPDNTFGIPSYYSINARAGWTSVDGKNEVYVWGRNLTDEVRITGLNRGTNPGGFNYASSYAPPRTFGIGYRREL